MSACPHGFRTRCLLCHKAPDACDLGDCQTSAAGHFTSFAWPGEWRRMCAPHRDAWKCEARTT